MFRSNGRRANVDVAAVEARETRVDIEARYGNGHAIQLLARTESEEFLVSSSDFAEFRRSYDILNSGFAFDSPYGPARRQSADALLLF